METCPLLLDFHAVSRLLKTCVNPQPEYFVWNRGEVEVMSQERIQLPKCHDFWLGAADMLVPRLAEPLGRDKKYPEKVMSKELG